MDWSNYGYGPDLELLAPAGPGGFDPLANEPPWGDQAYEGDFDLQIGGNVGGDVWVNSPVTHIAHQVNHISHISHGIQAPPVKALLAHDDDSAPSSWPELIRASVWGGL